MSTRSILMLLAGVASACLGGESTLPLGAICDEDTQCARGLVCLYGRCRSPCQLDADCDEGEVCVPSRSEPSVLACTFPDESCSADQPCPPGFICDVETGRCRGIPETFDGLVLGGGDTWHDDRNIVDLTTNDVTLTYIIDLSEVMNVYETPEDGSMLVGLHEAGAEDLHPGPWDTYQGGAGGWMVSYVLDLETDPEMFDMDDKHFLAASALRGEPDYDVLTPERVEDRFGSHESYGFWFDRDGVEIFQEDNWGMEAGGVWLTGGVYHIEIAYHAVSADLGTMMASVNGILPGFYTGESRDGPPELYPAGLSFRGDMSRMQLFAGNCAIDASQGPVTVTDMELSVNTREP